MTKSSPAMEQSADGPIGCDERQTPEEAALATLMVEALQLDMAPGDIDPDAPLFGEGLGLDSIDALEIALTVSRQYGVELRSSDEQKRLAFASLRNLSAFIEASRKAARTS